MGKLLKNAVHNNYAFWVCLFVSIVLLITSFFVPPLAVIDGSILAATGELFAFAALGSIITAINKGMDARITHRYTSLTIGDLNNDDKEDTL